uniref:Tail protein n=1 Tax=viral metagenome TaxID=1070528 RepID=A0A6H1ZMV1_9ZZZZ
MATKTVRIGSLNNVHQYDDGDWDGGIETDDTIKVGQAPTAPEDVLRLDDVGAVVGDVVGPAGASNNAVVLFDGATGKLLKDSGITAFGEVIGDGTAGRVLRLIGLTIQAGTAANSLKCTSISYWNGDANAVQDNIGKTGVAVGVWKLNVAGTVLQLLNTGLTGSLIAVISSNIYQNASTTDITMFCRGVSGIGINFYDTATGATQDITVLAAVGDIYLSISYLTSA